MEKIQVLPKKPKKQIRLLPKRSSRTSLEIERLVLIEDTLRISRKPGKTKRGPQGDFLKLVPSLVGSLLLVTVIIIGGFVAQKWGRARAYGDDFALIENDKNLISPEVAPAVVAELINQYQAKDQAPLFDDYEGFLSDNKPQCEMRDQVVFISQRPEERLIITDGLGTWGEFANCTKGYKYKVFWIGSQERAFICGLDTIEQGDQDMIYLELWQPLEDQSKYDKAYTVKICEG